MAGHCCLTGGYRPPTQGINPCTSLSDTPHHHHWAAWGLRAVALSDRGCLRLGNSQVGPCVPLLQRPVALRPQNDFGTFQPGIQCPLSLGLSVSAFSPATSLLPVLHPWAPRTPLTPAMGAAAGGGPAALSVPQQPCPQVGPLGGSRGPSGPFPGPAMPSKVPFPRRAWGSGWSSPHLGALNPARPVGCPLCKGGLGEVLGWQRGVLGWAPLPRPGCDPREPSLHPLPA